jgi:hypothetical protein
VKTAAPKTGEIDLIFSERSPLSAPREVARRLSLKENEVSPDYDLAQLPFKAYVPMNYEPATPVGIFVYLGYKNTVATPPAWHPVLEKSHLIFISPVCHSGPEYAPSVPLWETMGLALDAVHNLKKQYHVDPKRIYLMSWNDESTRIALATADVCTGFVVAMDSSWCRKMTLPNGMWYSPKWGSPPSSLFTAATERPFFFIEDEINDLAKLKMATMRRDGFQATADVLSLTEDLHYPNFKAEWFDQKVLPYLDKLSAANAAEHPANSDAESSAKAVAENKAAATTEFSPTAPPETISAAQHLLNVAQLLISSGQPDLAKVRLQQILDDYPNDAKAVEKAKELLGQLNGQ